MALAASAGLRLDPWQAYVLENSLGERTDGKWAARDVGLIVSRQNGKGSILEARELAGLFLLGERELIHTAHLFKTSADHFLRISGLIRNAPDLMRQVKPRGIKTGNGDESITLKSGARLRFVARSINGSGRGFSQIDFLCLDEAYDIQRATAKALLPMQLASRNPQTWYTSSVEDRGESTEILIRLRDRGRDKVSPTLAYFEWSAPDGSALDDWHARAAANPGLGIRLLHESLDSQIATLGEDALTEHFSIWPKRGQQLTSAFGLDKWEALRDDESRIVDGRCFAVAVSHDRMRSTIGVSGRNAAGKAHYEVVQTGDGSAWTVERLVQLQRKWTAPVVIDGHGPGSALVPLLQAAGVDLTIADTNAVLDAYATIYDAVQAGTAAWLFHPDLDSAVAGATARAVGDRKTWGRKGSLDISPLESITLAAHGSSIGLAVDYDVEGSIH